MRNPGQKTPWRTLVGPALIQRRLRQLILALWLAAFLGSVSLLAGAYVNDRAIHHDSARALATVTSVTSARATVIYQDREGTYHTPPGGVFYPSGLGEGQRVWVTYSQRNPDLVTVEGRRWTLAIIPAASIEITATLLTIIALLLVNGVGKKPRRENLSNDSATIKSTET